MIAAKQTDDSKRLLDNIVNEHKSNFISTRFIF
jgi:aldehyde dehydrogenase (NAD+)